MLTLILLITALAAVPGLALVACALLADRRALAEIEGAPLRPRRPSGLRAPIPPRTGR